jgi:hypothetical protein
MMKQLASDNGDSSRKFTATNNNSKSANSTVITLPANSDNTPAPDDRTELVALRSCKPIPESWLRMNNQNVQKARETEAQLLKTTKEFNINSKQVSSAALINREDIVNKLIKEKGTKRFTLTNGNKRTILNATNNDNASTLVDNSSSTIDNVLNGAKIIGPSA